ncbi:LOW QUALITY PROTEIN: ribosomal protein 63, mitochondrial, partial [Notechis scutatus]|uniref:LOW QUALITY PROTEIN: ribosomal protein 63, mitochondrial n=1 Tax=Notechis scutatus TaxID=8663 RepID=A0A6J1VUT9_9SAUR
GLQWIGKHRRPRFITPLIKAKKVRNLETEAENQYWLSCPYMTKKQAYRHDDKKCTCIKAVKNAEERAKFPDHGYASEYLKHLHVTKKWADEYL